MTAPTLILGTPAHFAASGIDTDEAMTVTYPAGIAAGDLLVLSFYAYGMTGNPTAPFSGIFSVPAGWSQVVNLDPIVSYAGGGPSPYDYRMHMRQWTRIADGTESGTSFTCTIGGALYRSGGAFDHRFRLGAAAPFGVAAPVGRWR